MRERRGITYLDDDDFSIISQNDIIAVFGDILGALTIFLGAIAGISLLVGGIGIMNIMLVSVTERTREIGLRKAVGAKRRDVLFQFLIEAVTLAVFGGIIGITLGVAGAQAISHGIRRLRSGGRPGCRFALALLLHGGRPLFRHLSGLSRQPPESHRCVAL